MEKDNINLTFSKIYLMDGKSKRVAIFEIEGEVAADNSYDIGSSDHIRSCKCMSK